MHFFHSVGDPGNCSSGSFSALRKIIDFVKAASALCLFLRTATSSWWLHRPVHFALRHVSALSHWHLPQISSRLCVGRGASADEGRWMRVGPGPNHSLDLFIFHDFPVWNPLFSMGLYLVRRDEALDGSGGDLCIFELCLCQGYGEIRRLADGVWQNMCVKQWADRSFVAHQVGYELDTLQSSRKNNCLLFRAKHTHVNVNSVLKRLLPVEMMKKRRNCTTSRSSTVPSPPAVHLSFLLHSSTPKPRNSSPRLFSLGWSWQDPSCLSLPTSWASKGKDSGKNPCLYIGFLYVCIWGQISLANPRKQKQWWWSWRSQIISSWEPRVAFLLFWRLICKGICRVSYTLELVNCRGSEVRDRDRRVEWVEMSIKHCLTNILKVGQNMPRLTAHSPARGMNVGILVPVYFS